MTKLVRIKKHFKKRDYWIYLKILKDDIKITSYMSDYLFYQSMKNDATLKYFLTKEGRPSKHDIEYIIPNVKIFMIKELKDDDIFKNRIIRL